MYYDIIHKESVDKDGNVTHELVAVTQAPKYDDITPKDMSLENQTKAGVKMQKVRSTNKQGVLESTDSAESSIFENGSNVVFENPVNNPVENPVNNPVKNPVNNPVENPVNNPVTESTPTSQS